MSEFFPDLAESDFPRHVLPGSGIREYPNWVFEDAARIAAEWPNSPHPTTDYHIDARSEQVNAGIHLPVTKDGKLIINYTGEADGPKQPGWMEVARPLGDAGTDTLVVLVGLSDNEPLRTTLFASAHQMSGLGVYRRGGWFQVFGVNNLGDSLPLSYPRIAPGSLLSGISETLQRRMLKLEEHIKIQKERELE